MSEKAFDATPARLERAKREGDRPRSQDLGAACTFACAASAALAGAGFAAPAMEEALASAATGAAALARGELVAWSQPWPQYAAIALYALAVPVAGVAGAALANVLQSGGFTFALAPPNLARLDPFAGAKKLFGRDAAIGGAKALVVACAVAAALAPAIRDAFAGAAERSSPAELAALVRASLIAIGGSALAVAALFGALDALVERAKWRRRLRMSHDEIKRDHKESEGDPQLRGRRRAAHRSLVRGSLARVRDAAFVVTNPTHVAIALEYAPPQVPVPRVLVRAVDAGARTVRALAREHGIPLIEDVALARELLAATQAGDFIPASCYGAVAQIVASLVRAGALRGRTS